MITGEGHVCVPLMGALHMLQLACQSQKAGTNLEQERHLMLDSIQEECLFQDGI